MTLLGFKELALEDTGRLKEELYSLLDVSVVTGSRENYLSYLQWLTPIWLYLETQIEASPLAGRRDLNLPTKFRSPLMVADCYHLLGDSAPPATRLFPDLKVFDHTPGLGEAAGALWILEDLELDFRRYKRGLARVGIKGRGAQFYRGTDWRKRNRGNVIASWINAELSAKARAEAVEGAHLALSALVSHFRDFRSFLAESSETALLER